VVAARRTALLEEVAGTIQTRAARRLLSQPI
jgi:hypothetical protein